MVKILTDNPETLLILATIFLLVGLILLLTAFLKNSGKKIRFDKK